MMGDLIRVLPALSGFFTIAVLIALGWLLARRRFLTVEHRSMMSSLALYVATPALMFVTMEQADISRVFARSVIASYGAIAVSGLVYISATIVYFHHNLADRTIGTLLSCYSNAGNLGIPVAAYALKDVTWMVPILLVQLVILQPTALAILDWQTAKRDGRRLPVAKLVSLPFRNPMTVGTLAGLVVNLVHRQVAAFTIPDFIFHPIDMLGGMAVPLMLLAFGISLCLDPKPAGGAQRTESWFVVGLKVILQPLVAYVLAAWVLRLDPVAVRAITVIACLPPAQNTFIFASKYNVRMVFARDTTFRATIVAVISILVAATVLA